MLWVARWKAGLYEVDLVCEADDYAAAERKIGEAIKDSGLNPTTPVLLADLKPYELNSLSFTSTAARN